MARQHFRFGNPETLYDMHKDPPRLTPADRIACMSFWGS